MNLLTSEYFKVECMHAKLNNMTFSVFSSWEKSYGYPFGWIAIYFSGMIGKESWKWQHFGQGLAVDDADAEDLIELNEDIG